MALLADDSHIERHAKRKTKAKSKQKKRTHKWFLRGEHERLWLRRALCQGAQIRGSLPLQWGVTDLGYPRIAY